MTLQAHASRVKISWIKWFPSNCHFVPCSFTQPLPVCVTGQWQQVPRLKNILGLETNVDVYGGLFKENGRLTRPTRHSLDNR